MPAVPSSGTATVTIPADDQILVTREFDAPRELVYRAWTEPELVRRWWAGKRGEVTSAEIDMRVGGSWRYVMVTEGGFEVAFHGEFREIVPNERIVSTEIYEGAPPEAGDEPVVNVITFIDLDDGRTRLDLLSRCPSREVRDLIIDSGMETGLQEGLDLLEQIAIALR